MKGRVKAFTFSNVMKVFKAAYQIAPLVLPLRLSGRYFCKYLFCFYVQADRDNPYKITSSTATSRLVAAGLGSNPPPTWKQAVSSFLLEPRRFHRTLLFVNSPRPSAVRVANAHAPISKPLLYWCSIYLPSSPDHMIPYLDVQTVRYTHATLDERPPSRDATLAQLRGAGERAGALS